MAEAPLSAEEIAHRGFPSSFRGFDPSEVRAYLVRVADQLRAATAKERELQHKLTEAERRAANPVIDQAMLTRALGEETSRVLASAQQAAQDLKARAEESVAKILREAHEQAQRVRAEAEVVLDRRTEEAEKVAGEIRAGAQVEAQAVVEQARREAEAARNEVAEQARQLVQEAQAARARVLGDLTRRRRIAHMQVEQLRAGRNRLLDAYRVVRRTLDEVADELERVEAEARSAASAAGRRVEEALEGADVPLEEGEESPQELEVSDQASPEVQVPAVPGAGQEGPTALAPLAGAAVTQLGPLAGAAVTQLTPESPEAPAASVSEPSRTPRTGRSAGTQPVVARGERVDERKLSSLRILRRPRADAVAGPGALEVPSEVEGVRVIAASSEPVEPAAVRAPVASTPATPSIMPGVSWAPPPAAAEPASPPPAPAELTSPPPAPASPQLAEATEAGAAPPPASSPVDAIFARIRAGSAAPDAEERPSPGADVMGPPEPTLEPGADAAAEVAAPAPTSAGDVEAKDVREDELLLQHRDGAVEAIEAALTRRLKRALQDEHNDVLDRLRSWRGGPVTSALLPPTEVQAAGYRSSARELLLDAARAGARFASADDAHVADADVDLVLVELTEALVGPLRRGIERGLDGAQQDPSTLVDCIGAAYRESKSQRLEGIAADAVIGAFSRGTLSAGSGAVLRWVVDDGDRACSDCDDNALAGPTPAGQPFPTGQPHPPAHGGCRCLIAIGSP